MCLCLLWLNVSVIKQWFNLLFCQTGLFLQLCLQSLNLYTKRQSLDKLNNLRTNRDYQQWINQIFLDLERITHSPGDVTIGYHSCICLGSQHMHLLMEFFFYVLFWTPEKLNIYQWLNYLILNFTTFSLCFWQKDNYTDVSKLQVTVVVMCHSTFLGPWKSLLCSSDAEIFFLPESTALLTYRNLGDQGR